MMIYVIEIESLKKIFMLYKSKIKNLGAKAVDEKYKYEIELSRNWHQNFISIKNIRLS